LNGSNLGISRSNASCLNYAKGCACGRGISRSNASCLNYAKGCVCGRGIAAILSADFTP
jgi:predicted protein tyrosine phosphatase